MEKLPVDSNVENGYRSMLDRSRGTEALSSWGKMKEVERKNGQMSELLRGAEHRPFQAELKWVISGTWRISWGCLLDKCGDILEGQQQ